MHGKKNDPWRVSHGFDLLRHSKTVHIWQFNIEQNQNRLEVERQLNGRSRHHQ